MLLNKLLKKKIKESFSSVLPITAIVAILSIILVPISIDTMIMFIVGAALLIIGMGFFTLGTDMAMIPMGEGIGASLTKFKKSFIIGIVVFIMGVIVTVAEPDLQVLARQVPAIPDAILVWTVAVGVGMFLVVAIFRILFKVPLSKLLLMFYGVIVVVSFFTPNSFIAVAFDSGGVTTGPVTVPFIMALGLGLAAVRSDKDSEGDSFGLVALCSIGPILSVLLLGIIYNPSNATYEKVNIADIHTTRDVFLQFARELPHYIQEVFIAIAPLVIFFLIYQVFSRRYKKQQLLKIGVGFLYTVIGLVLFLTGVNVGFIPVGHLMGAGLATLPYAWILVPIGMLIGYYIVSAEPAVHVLTKQVDEVTGGAVQEKVMMLYLAIGMSISLGISMLRVLLEIDIFWFLIPGYAIALTLTFFVPKIFTGIAFDSGGVCSGPMTSTFLLPFAMGACEAIGGNVLTDAFGIVAMVAMTPLITIQVMGLFYQRKMKALEAEQDIEILEIAQEETI